MRILLVAATRDEVAPLLRAFGGQDPAGARLSEHRFAGHDIHLLMTGIGMVATAAWCSRVLAERSFDVALNVGVCGSFDREHALGHVVHVVSDRIAELGAEDGDTFLSIDQLNLGSRDVDPGAAYAGAELVNTSPPTNAVLAAMPRVSGITVNTVHGSERSIAAVVERFKPQVETMEGAAFMYACLIHGVAFAQVRAVSNIVERRNRSAWRLPMAISSLGATTAVMLEAM